MSASWVDHAIWWHVYPLGFVGAPIRDAAASDLRPSEPVHRLRQLEAWLDYAIELGMSALVLGPVFASQTHGYDTIDYNRIDPRLGDDADFDRLIAAAQSRGIRVVLDGVFNHVSAEFDRPELFRLRDPGDPSKGWADFEGHGSLVALDHANPAVVDLVADVMRHWLARGIDGWRLDAAYAVDPAFWRAVLPRVRADYPDAWFVGEVIHGDYADFVARSGVDSVTQYELWKANWSALVDRNFFELAWALERHNTFLDSFVPYTFVGNHDVTRIATKVADERLAVLALVVLLTTGGTPAIYYGDEQAYRGTKFEQLGGDDQVRPPFPGSPEDLSMLGRWMRDIHHDLIGIRRRNPWLVNARTSRLEVTNTTFRYAVERSAPSVGPDQRLVVELDVTATPRAGIRQGGAEIFTFTS